MHAISLPVPHFLPLLLSGIFFAGGATRAETYRERLLADEPVAYWRFDDIVECCTPNETHETMRANAGPNVSLLEPGPRPPAFSAFPEENTAADFTQFDRDTFLRVKDPGPLSVFDFAKGHTITVEAWVRPLKLAIGQEAIVATKGATGNEGVAANNQNWALQVRGVAAENPRAAAAQAERSAEPSATKGEASSPGGEKNAASAGSTAARAADRVVLATVSFRFRDEKNAGEASWHRFTSTRGFLPGKEWHHIAATYTFGDPSGARLWIDGEPVAGSWDMGGATDLGPVVDNDELWIGGGVGGRAESQFPGQIDELAIYRTALTVERMKLHALGEGPIPALYPTATGKK